MPIHKLIKTGNGALLSYHVATRTEVALGDPSELAFVTVCSWPEEADFISNGGLSPVSVIHPGVPLQPLGGTSYQSAIESSLVAAVTSPLYGGTVVAAVTGIEAARVRQWARLKQTRELLDAQSLEIDGIAINADERSCQKLFRAILDMQFSGQAARKWVCADDLERELTAAQLAAFGAAIVARTQSLVEISFALRAQVFDPLKTTTQEIEAVVWPMAPIEPVEP